MKNPVVILGRWYSLWRKMRKYPGVYSLPDACAQLRYLLQPQRLTEWELRQWIRKELSIRSESDGVLEIEIKRNGLIFYWLGGLSGGLAMGVRQEMEPSHPHYYNVPPIHLTPASLVLDVGACEGLFAIRVARARQAARIICFEPSARTASFLARAAEKNGVADRIKVEVFAVGRASGEVYFTDSESPEANRVVSTAVGGARKTPQVCLDDYCRDKQIRLGATDLIKVDAEGADFDVIRGAERIIREGAPQIAVTTYHEPAHAGDLIEFLRSLQPGYRFRLKGVTCFRTPDSIRPVLLQAALPLNARAGQ